jgi:DNA-binding transcriptional MerR regulator
MMVEYLTRNEKPETRNNLYFYFMGKELEQIPFEFADEQAKEEIPAPAKPAEVVHKKGNNVRGRKSVKAMSEEAENLEIPDDEQLFQKQYYPIGEVAQMFRVNSSLLRYWETEFSLELRKNRKGDRFFKPEDIKTLLLIYDLLRRRKFTIEGAKEFLKRNKQADEKYALIQSLQRMKTFLLELKANL